MKKKILTLSLSRLDSGAHFNYLEAVLARVNKTTEVKTAVATELATLKTAFDTENKFLKVSKKNVMTDSISRHDKLRGGFYTSYKRIVKSYLVFETGEYFEAAKPLWQHIIDYGIKTKMQLDKETGLLSNFNEDLETKYSENIEKLHLTIFTSRLKEENEAVKKLLKERDDEDSARVLGGLKKARKDADLAYRELIESINAYARFNTSDELTKLIAEMNRHIRRMKQRIIDKATTKGTNSKPSSKPNDKPVTDKPTTGDETETSDEEKPDTGNEDAFPSVDDSDNESGGDTSGGEDSGGDGSDDDRPVVDDSDDEDGLPVVQ